jgi:SAM-dependent methyltransferase/uncharacterized protein YbaR (Trm112 family)
MLCPACRAPLGEWTTAGTEACGGCGVIFPSLGGIPCLLANPDSWRATWRQQLGAFDAQAAETLAQLQEEQTLPGLLPATVQRLAACHAAAAALHGQLHQLLDPLLTPEDARAGSFPVDTTRAPRPLTHYLDLVFRDWAWDGDDVAEDDAPNTPSEAALALAEVRAVAGEGSLGRTLVLGAGACRLAYELHLQGRQSVDQSDDHETFALDVDVLLLAAARRIIRGQPLALTEAPTEANDLDALAARHDLTAPNGPLGDDHFHFVLANGLAAPFAPGSFDTIVTPWFIDVGPPDLRPLLRSIHALLVPHGRWLNFGPLVYKREIPLHRRFTIQEVLSLSQQAGFDVGEPRVSTLPYTLSPLNGRGRLERTVAFAARKR